MSATQEQNPGSSSLPQRTDPKSFIVQGFAGLRNAIFPVVAIFFAMRDQGFLAVIAALFAGIAIIAIGAVGAYLRWRKLTYQINAEDIRVESGIVSRAARSVPFERIQDVSLEQTLVPRLFGLVTVKFETGSGGGEDIALAYLTEAEGERLRDLVRELRDAENAPEAVLSQAEGGEAALEAARATSSDRLLFAMDPRRLFTFGLFEFSLAVFAVIAGLAQYADWFVDFEIWDPDLWRELASEQSGWIASLGQIGQVIGAIGSLIALVLVGSITGMVRVFLRDWNFRLEDTPRGFRRRRGLFTRTDVVMPAHRVQAIRIKTGWIRYRFGWHALKFVSLAQDQGSANHDVAPFAKLDEIDPIVRASGFEPVGEGLDWRKTDPRYWIDQTVIAGGIALMVALGNAIFGSLWIAMIPLAVAVIIAAANWYGYKVHAHALDDDQVIIRTGYFSPDVQIGSRVKLHSVNISQGPLAQRRGYANLNFGLAGGAMSIAGLPVERAQELRRAILASIAAKDFSEIYRAPEPRLAA